MDPVVIPIVTLENFDADHSEVSPSSAFRWLNCPGSIGMQRDLNNSGSSSEAAAEGTAAHWLAEVVLKEYPLGTRAEELDIYRGETIRVSNTDREGNTTTYDFIICKLMTEYVLEYILLCESLAFGADYIEIEKKVDLTAYTSIDGNPSHGYLDFTCVEGGVLNILDFKYGKNWAVNAHENSQLMLYAKGAYDELSTYFDIKSIRMLINQPRNGGTTEYTITPDQLDLWVMAYVEPAITEIKEGSTRLECNPKVQCVFCPNESDCKLLAATLLNGMFEKIPAGEEPTEENKFNLIDHQVLTEAEKVALFKIKGSITSWFTKLTKNLNAKALGGNMPEGLKYVKGKGSRAFKDIAKAESALARQGYGVDVRRIPAKLKSPAQIEKLIGKTHRIMKTYVENFDGSPTLVSIDDKREALELDPGTSTFEKIETEKQEND